MEVHKNAKLVKWKNKISLPVDCYDILAYQENYRKAQHIQVCLRIILPMKVHVSPMALAIRYEDPPAWETRWVSSLSTVSYLQTVLRCYSSAKGLPFYEKNRDFCDKVYKSMVDQTLQLETELMEKVSTCKSGADFKPIIQAHTCKYIHMLEKCLVVLFSISTNLNDYLTPIVDPASIQLEEEDNDVFRETFQVFFQQKDILAKTNIFKFESSIYDNYLEFLCEQLNK